MLILYLRKKTGLLGSGLSILRERSVHELPTKPVVTLQAIFIQPNLPFVCNLCKREQYVHDMPAISRDIPQ